MKYSKLNKAVFILFIITILGCQNKKNVENDILIESVTLPGLFVNVIWNEDSLIIQDVNRPFLGRLWNINPDGTNLEKIELPEHYPGCGRTGFIAPVLLPDGRLGYMRECQNLEPGWSIFMMAYNMDTGEVEQLIEEELPNKSGPRGAFSWNLDMTQGITSDGAGGGLGEQIYFFTRNGWNYWENSEYLQAFGTEWSPNGEKIAFIAAPGSGIIGPSQLRAPYNLYLMSPESLDPQPILENIYHPRGASWSPDSQWIAFKATLNNLISQKEGLWLINVKTKDLCFVAEGDFSRPVWSPDGNKLAAIDFSSESDSESMLVIIDLLNFFGDSSEKEAVCLTN